jgi:hypothetical protein
MLWAFQDFASDKNMDMAIVIRYGVLQGDGIKGITAAQRCVGACKTENVVLDLQATFK